MKQYVLMSNEELGELEHFGVRGMKWGVRKQQISKGVRRLKRQAVKTGKQGVRAVKRWRRTQVRAAKQLSKQAKAGSKEEMRTIKKNWKNPKKMAKDIYNIEKSTAKKQWNTMTKTQKVALATYVVSTIYELGRIRGM